VKLNDMVATWLTWKMGRTYFQVGKEVIKKRFRLLLGKEGKGGIHANGVRPGRSTKKHSEKGEDDIVHQEASST